MPYDAVSTQPFAVSNARPNCQLCPAASACLIQGACHEDIAAWNGLAQNFLSLPSAGKSLIDTGAPANALYIVRAGCLKSSTVDAEGQERVRAFHLPGDIIGLDALGGESYPCNVIAVVPSQVCKVSKSQALDLLGKSPALMQRLLARTSHELAQALSLAGDYTAEQRVAAFLLSLQRRLGTAAGTMRLPMPRRDIANYLRLATETVCRVLTRFENKGWIDSDDKKLTVKKADGLRQLSMALQLGQSAPALLAA